MTKVISTFPLDLLNTPVLIGCPSDQYNGCYGLGSGTVWATSMDHKPFSSYVNKYHHFEALDELYLNIRRMELGNCRGVMIWSSG